MNSSTNTPTDLPLTGIRVIEISHMVMGPTCGMILGDLGADVIKVEPPRGDGTRRLLGTGAGFFRTFNRNKKSVTLDMDSPAGLAALHKLVDSADVFIENFKPGRMKDLGIDYDAVRARNPKIIYVSHKGFLQGPYEKRLALDEVVQMMAGLAYMTAPAVRSTTSWAACSAPLACSRPCSNASTAAKARKSRVPCLKTAYCCRPSICSNLPSPVWRPHQCRRASVPGRCMTSSNWPPANRCSSPPPATRSGAPCANSLRAPTCWPMRACKPITSVSSCANGCCKPCAEP